jgi:hypothetical protein
VLAVQSVPAERAPRDDKPVKYRALFASPDEQADPSGLQWAYCMIRKPITVIGPAALECYAPGGKGLISLGTGLTAEGIIDKEDCSIFGPSPPVPKGDEPPSRPADPDVSGGYYQPVRVLVPTDQETDYVVGVTRIGCGIAGATAEQSIDYNDRYRPNENPAIDEIVVTHSGGEKEMFPVGDTVPHVMVASREQLTLEVQWSDCPLESTCGDGICGASEYADDQRVMGELVPGCPEDCEMPQGCTGSEPYVTLDPAAREIVSHREAMRVSWFATAGNYVHDRTGYTENEVSRTHITNDWTAPEREGPVHLWFVLRDDRGGVGWTELVIDVQP